MPLSRDPADGQVYYQVTNHPTQGWRVARFCDNGSNASVYYARGEQEFCELLAAAGAAHEGGTVEPA